MKPAGWNTVNSDWIMPAIAMTIVSNVEYYMP